VLLVQCSTEPLAPSSRPSALTTRTLRSSTRKTHCVTDSTVARTVAGVLRALIHQYATAPTSRRNGQQREKNARVLFAPQARTMLSNDSKSSKRRPGG
jgi:hypothetical protein